MLDNSQLKTSRLNHYKEYKKVKNLDYYFNNSPQNATAFLPSLILSLLYSEDFLLDQKLIKLLMRIYSQREEFVTNLQRMEIVSTEKEIQMYLKV